MNPSKKAIESAMEAMPFHYRESAEYWRTALSVAYAIDFGVQNAENVVECRWLQDEDGTWKTDCGNAYEIIDGTPRNNRMSFCCFCGGKLSYRSFRDA